MRWAFSKLLMKFWCAPFFSCFPISLFQENIITYLKRFFFNLTFTHPVKRQPVRNPIVLVKGDTFSTRRQTLREGVVLTLVNSFFLQTLVEFNINSIDPSPCSAKGFCVFLGLARRSGLCVMDVNIGRADGFCSLLLCCSACIRGEICRRSSGGGSHAQQLQQARPPLQPGFLKNERCRKILQLLAHS